MSLLVIIEGLDRTGKSTLAHLISKETGAQVTHFSKPEKEPVFEYTDPLLALTHKSRNVFDRYHVGELVWPTIFGRASSFSPVQNAYVEMALQSRGAVIVKTRRNMDDLREHLIRDNEPLDPGMAEHAEELFQAALVQAHSTIPVLDWRLGAPIDFITDTAFRRGSASTTAVLDITQRIVGNTDAPALMVVCDSPTALPMVPGMSFPTSKYLISELMFFDGLMQQVVLVSHKTPLGDVWEELFSPTVIALGRNAAGALEKDGVPFEMIQPPDTARTQYDHAGPGAYGEAIRRRIT